MREENSPLNKNLEISLYINIEGHSLCVFRRAITRSVMEVIESDASMYNVIVRPETIGVASARSVKHFLENLYKMVGEKRIKAVAENSVLRREVSDFLKDYIEACDAYEDSSIKVGY